MTDTFEQNFTSEDEHLHSPGPLDTPPPPTTDQNVAGNTNECNEMFLPGDLVELMTDFSLPSNADLLQKLETIEYDVQTLKNTTTIENKEIVLTQTKLEEDVRKLTESMGRFEEQNRHIITMLEKLTQANTPPFAQPNSLEVPLGVPELPRTDRPGNNSIGNTQQYQISSLPTESNIRTDDQHVNRLTTTNELRWNSDGVDRIRLEKSLRKPAVGQEPNVETAGDTSTLNTSTVPDVQLQVEQTLVNAESSSSITIPSDISLVTCNDEPTKFSLLHPVREGINQKNERDTIIKDGFNKDLVLLVYGKPLPDDVDIEIGAIFTAFGIRYHSIHRLRDGNVYKYLYTRRITTTGKSPQRIKLNNIRLRRGCNNNMRKNNSAECKNVTNNNEEFILLPYPLNESVSTNIQKAKDLNGQFNCKRIQIVYRFLKNGAYLLNGDTFCTNFFYEKTIIPPDLYTLVVSNKSRHEKDITFNERNQYQMEYAVEIPEPFHCTLISGFKWLKISIITDGNLSPIYTIDTKNGKKANPNYILIEKFSFNLPLVIFKQSLPELVNNQKVQDASHKTSARSSTTYDVTMNNVYSVLNITGLNRFKIQIQIIHNEKVPDESSNTYYPKCIPWQSEEFIDKTNTGQKRSIEDSCDSNPELSPCKAAKTSQST